MKSKALAIALIVVGVAATIGGLYGQIFLTEDEGHHDGRDVTFALESASGADELIVTSPAPNQVQVQLQRAGQPLGLGEVHGAPMHVFVIGEQLDSFAHEVAESSEVATTAPAGDVRIVVQAAPDGGPDLLELGASVEVEGEPGDPQNIADTDEWTNGDLTVRRQGLDFVLSEPWNGDDVYEGPAFLSLVRADDFAFTHAHATVVGDDRFSFSTDLPGSGDYLAALEFMQNGELVTALFRFTI